MLICNTALLHVQITLSTDRIFQWHSYKVIKDHHQIIWWFPLYRPEAKWSNQAQNILDVMADIFLQYHCYWLHQCHGQELWSNLHQGWSLPSFDGIHGSHLQCWRPYCVGPPHGHHLLQGELWLVTSELWGIFFLYTLYIKIPQMYQIFSDVSNTAVL